jgi:hypothetical protein
MKVLMVTSWDCKCGVAALSNNLVYNLLPLGVDVTVLCNEISEDSVWNSRNKGWGVLKVYSNAFGVKWFEEDDFVNPHIFEAHSDADIIHVQYQISLYKQPEFNEVLKNIKRDQKFVATVHDSVIGEFNTDFFDAVITHRPDIVRNSTTLPFPTLYTPPKIATFGLGRTQVELIQSVCRGIGAELTVYDPDDYWYETDEELRDELSQHDAIVLWYNDNPGMKSTSAAARLAMATYRRVFVNDIGWFSDVKSRVEVFKDMLDLENKLRGTLNRDFLWDNSYTNYAKKHLEIYESLI